MRLWVPILVVVLLVGYFLVANIGSSMALNDIASRPILALTRDAGAVRVPIQTPGQPARPDEARMLGGQGISFGFAMGFGLPDGGTVTCRIRIRTLSCDGGWTAERPP